MGKEKGFGVGETREEGREDDQDSILKTSLKRKKLWQKEGEGTEGKQIFVLTSIYETRLKKRRTRKISVTSRPELGPGNAEKDGRKERRTDQSVFSLSVYHGWWVKEGLIGTLDQNCEVLRQEGFRECRIVLFRTRFVVRGSVTALSRFFPASFSSVLVFFLNRILDAEPSSRWTKSVRCLSIEFN